MKTSRVLDLRPVKGHDLSEGCAQPLAFTIATYLPGEAKWRTYDVAQPPPPPLAASPTAHYMLVHKCLNERASEYLITDCCWAGSRRFGTRSADRQMLEVVSVNTSFGDRSFAAAAAAATRAWNGLRDTVCDTVLCLRTLLRNC